MAFVLNTIIKNAILSRRAMNIIFILFIRLSLGSVMLIHALSI
jgi:hypothetical protein